MLKENNKKKLNFISIILIVIGQIGFLGGAIISSRLVEFKRELPLGNTEDIVVSRDGRIFLGLQFYGKIQSYDAKGKFLKNWDVDNSAGAFRLDICDDTLLVATARGDLLIKYNVEGKIIDKQSIRNIYLKHRESNPYVDSFNNLTYKLNHGLLASVTKIENGKSEKIISMPFFLMIFKGPMPAFLFAAIGVIIQFVMNKEKIIKDIMR
jgi:hypothetical protein